MYAPTWTRFSSLNSMGEALVQALVDRGYQVLVKLHENSLDGTFVNSGGIDWLTRLEPTVTRGGGRFIRSSDASPWLVAADVLITDHSSIGFEYLLRDHPLIRIVVPELIERTDIAPEYVELLAHASTPAHSVEETVSAVAESFERPAGRSAARREVAAELFHAPGRATDRAVAELYTLLELDVMERESRLAFPTSSTHEPALTSGEPCR